MITDPQSSCATADEQPRRKKRRRDDAPEQDASEPLPTFGNKRRRDGLAAREDEAPAEPKTASKRRRAGEESLLAAVAAATARPPEGKNEKKKKKKKKARKVEWPSASAEQLAAAGKVVRAVARGEAGWPFEAPVTDAMAPGYSREIARPMDLGTIAKALKSGNYASLGARSTPCPAESSL